MGVLFDVVRILGICARLFICSRAYVGSLVVFGVLLTQFPVRSAIRNSGIVVITVDCAIVSSQDLLVLRVGGRII